MQLSHLKVLLKLLWPFVRNIFSKHNYTAEPKVEIPGRAKENPVIIVVIGHKRMAMTTAQAKRLWGILGNQIERITPDAKFR